MPNGDGSHVSLHGNYDTLGDMLPPTGRHVTWSSEMDA